jgi:hypothetical protein
LHNRLLGTEKHFSFLTIVLWSEYVIWFRKYPPSATIRAIEKNATYKSRRRVNPSLEEGDPPRSVCQTFQKPHILYTYIPTGQLSIAHLLDHSRTSRPSVALTVAVWKRVVNKSSPFVKNEHFKITYWLIVIKLQLWLDLFHNYLVLTFSCPDFETVSNTVALQ